MDNQPGWPAVATKITARLHELGWTTAEFARQSGISDTKLREFTTGAITSNPRASTLRKMELALEWPHGAIAQILEAGDFEWPASDDGRILSSVATARGSPVMRLEAPEAAAERALAATLTGAESAEERRRILSALILRAAQELERLEASRSHPGDRP